MQKLLRETTGRLADSSLGQGRCELGMWFQKERKQQRAMRLCQKDRRDDLKRLMWTKLGTILASGNKQP